MFTLVRIRGKNFRKKPHKLEWDQEEPTSSNMPAYRSQGRSEECGLPGDDLATSDQIAMEPTESTQNASSLSSLERLPLEILQSIFLLSENLNLPKVSAHIGSALASTHTRTELVMQTFGYKEKTKLKDVGCIVVSDGLPQNVDLQTTLLRQRWLSYAFFRHCQKTYMLRHAIKLYRDNASGISQDSQAATVADIVRFFDDYYNVHDRLRKQLKVWLQTAGPAERTDLENRTMVLQERSEFKWTAGSGIKHTISLLRQGSKMRDATPPVLHPITKEDGTRGQMITMPKSVFNIPTFIAHCQLPEKLLHGPWTNQRGQFLEMLWNNGCSIDWVNSTSGEVALRGLEDAIREDNPMAVQALVRWSPVFLGPPVVKLQGPFESVSNDHLDAEVDRIIAPQNKWNFRFEPSDDQVLTYKVVPRTRHLRIAVLEKKCDMQVLNALLSAIFTNIDWDDPDVLNWALQQIAEADDGSGHALGQIEDNGTALLRLLDQGRAAQEVRSQVQE